MIYCDLVDERRTKAEIDYNSVAEYCKSVASNKETDDVMAIIANALSKKGYIVEMYGSCDDGKYHPVMKVTGKYFYTTVYFDSDDIRVGQINTLSCIKD